MRIAIHSIFIARENILFLKDWIDYHYNLGITEFYLYDNSYVEKTGGKHGNSNFEAGSVNKHNIDYAAATDHLSDSDIDRELKAIQESYPVGVVNYICWQPLTASGVIYMNQPGALRTTLDNLHKRRGTESQVDWMVNLDIDEYLTLAPDLDLITFMSDLSEDTSVVWLYQMKHLSRWSDLDTPVLQKPALWDYPRRISWKYICTCLGGAWKPTVHKVRSCGKTITQKDSIWFRHYNGTELTIK
jgi:hypothetical protein